MNPPQRALLPESARATLEDFGDTLGLTLELWARDEDGDERCLFQSHGIPEGVDPSATAVLNPRDGLRYELRLWSENADDPEALVQLVGRTTERTLDFAKEVRFFTLELSERFEEINLLYSISETLGSILRMDDAGRLILEELCDVLGARRGSLWVVDRAGVELRLVAQVGAGGVREPIPVSDPAAVTAAVYRDSRSVIATREMLQEQSLPGVGLEPSDSVLSVPIRYTPPSGDPKTVGVINLIGRRHGGRFTAADQKLLAAIASQVGAAVENNRLVHQSVARERMAREMELAHNLQQKLLPPVGRVQGFEVAARVQPAELVGGDFYQVFRLPHGRVGVMVGDVSTHGFPAALIMALTMSAASIYAGVTSSPAEVLRRLDAALIDELETTEMYLSLFYAVVDPAGGTVTYSNAGHPHAFVIRDEGEWQRLEATDPPMGFAGPDAYGEASLPWNRAGDHLFVFTDGLSDTLTSTEQSNGEAYVLSTVQEHRAEGPDAVVKRLFELAAEAESSVPADDRTAVLLTGA